MELERGHGGLRYLARSGPWRSAPVRSPVARAAGTPAVNIWAERVFERLDRRAIRAGLSSRAATALYAGGAELVLLGSFPHSPWKGWRTKQP
jgi:hypothetical protein